MGLPRGRFCTPELALHPLACGPRGLSAPAYSYYTASCISLLAKSRIRLFSMSALLYGPVGALTVLPGRHCIAS